MIEVRDGVPNSVRRAVASGFFGGLQISGPLAGSGYELRRSEMFIGTEGPEYELRRSGMYTLLIESLALQYTNISLLKELGM